MSTNDLKSRIFATGPIPVAVYMKQVLTNPTAGYYMTTKDVLGKKGDLITSPEIVKIFVEMVEGMVRKQVVQVWSSGTIAAELGPGKGTMVPDILKCSIR